MIGIRRMDNLPNNWPAEMPNVPEDSHGWFRDHNKKVLSRFLNKDDMVIELGSWLGSSTRFIADRCKHVIAIDHWKGGPEHHNSTWQSIKGRLPKLYETFLRNCWSRKDKITPLKMDTVEGLTECSKAGVSPNLIYIDASHEYTDVIADLTLAAKLFPKALIIGDDWERKGVHQAVMNYTYSKDIVLKVYGNVWWIR